MEHHLKKCQEAILEIRQDAIKIRRKLKTLRSVFKQQDDEIRNLNKDLPLAHSRTFSPTKDPYHASHADEETIKKMCPEIPKTYNTLEECIAILELYSKYMPILLHACETYDNAVKQQSKIILAQKHAKLEHEQQHPGINDQTTSSVLRPQLTELSISEMTQAATLLPNVLQAHILPERKHLFDHIVRGNWSHFDHFNNTSHQSVPIATVAFACTKKHLVASWNTAHIDEILMDGQKYYDECIRNITDEDNEDPSIDSTNLHPHLIFKSKHFLVTDQLSYRGDKLTEENLLFAFENFNEDNYKYFILTYGRKSYGIIRYWVSRFAFFDSYGRDSNGMQQHGKPTGKAAILYFETYKHLTNFVIQQCDHCDKSHFTLTPISVNLDQDQPGNDITPSDTDYSDFTDQHTDITQFGDLEQ